MDISKVHLIFPPTKYHRRVRDKLALPPLGLAYIAGVVRKDCEVKILDATVEGYYQPRDIRPNPQHDRNFVQSENESNHHTHDGMQSKKR